MSQRSVIFISLAAVLIGVLLGIAIWRSPAAGQGLLFGSLPGPARTAETSLQAIGGGTDLMSRAITVSGTGETRAKPDMAFVSVGVETQGATADQAQQENNARMNAVIEAIKALRIPENDIQTSALNLQPVYSNGQRPGATEPQIVGYRATAQVRVRVTDLAKTGPVIDEAVKAGANTAGNVRFGIADDDELRKQALQNAVRDARGKADAMASALGVTITGVQSAGEASISTPLTMQESLRADLAAAPAATPIEPGELTIIAQVRIAYSY